MNEDTANKAKTDDSASISEEKKEDVKEMSESESTAASIEKTLKSLEKNASEDEPLITSARALLKVLGGDILTAQVIRKQIFLIILVVGFLFIYISNRYSVQKDLIELDHLRTELQDAKYKALSSSSQITERSRESHILELLKNNKDSMLKIASQPPYIINVPEGE